MAQGSRLRASSPYSPVYHNRGGAGFADVTQDWGLRDHRPVGAYLYLDYDLDGDLDILSYPFQLSPVLWENRAGGESMVVTAIDATSANREAIGAGLIVHTEDGRSMARSLRASGGYQSHDRVRAHVGLGSSGRPASLEWRWPDGESTRLTAEGLLPGRYRMIRVEPQ